MHEVEMGSPIYLDEAGSPDAQAWHESVVSLGNDLLSLRVFAKAQLLELRETENLVEIRGRDRVGLLLLPSGRRIVLRTKVPSVNLLEWLAYIGDFPELTAWTKERAIEAGDQFEKCLCELFLDELDVITRVHLRKGFQSLDIESSQIRGQIQVTRLSQRPWRLPRLPQIVRSRTLDIDVNTVLALALDKVVLHSINLSNDHRKRLAQLRDVWGGVSRVARDLTSLVNSVQSGPPHGYRRALQIARLILLGANLDPQHGVGGRVFTISLANIWERGLEKMFTELQTETDWWVVPASERIRHWDDSAGSGNPNRWMLADLIIARGKERAVLDAKYKCDFGDESRNDRFQICTYAIAFDSEKVSLAYPQESPNGIRKLLTTCSASIRSSFDTAL